MKCQQTPQIVQSRKRGLLVYKQKKDVIFSQKHSHDNNNGIIVRRQGFSGGMLRYRGAIQVQYTVTITRD